LTQKVVVRVERGKNDFISGLKKKARGGINHIATASHHVTTVDESITGQLASVFHEKAGECQVDFSFSVGFSFSSLMEVFFG